MDSCRSKTIIIAEAGVNHNGSIDMAKSLIDAAAMAKADYVKFQTFKTENLVSKSAQLAEYQEKNLHNSTEGQYEMLKALELTPDDHRVLKIYCDSRGIKFLSTAFDLESIDFLASLGLDLWKIPSGEITNYPYLKRIAHYGGKVLLSTGMCEMEDITNAFDLLVKEGIKPEDITILHCNTEYPTPMKDVNLLAMNHIRNVTGAKIGYSDHTVGIEVPIAAVALGAAVIEKHFTLDQSLPGPDQKASVEPHDLASMVRAIHNIEQAMGDGVKRISESERKNMEVARKSIVAAKEIKKGELLTEENICAKRPGSGISPMLWNEVVGTLAIRDFKQDEMIEL